MRIFLSVLLLISTVAGATDLISHGVLQIYVFDGDHIPKKSYVHIKKTEDAKPVKTPVYMGMLEIEKEQGVLYLSAKKKGPFHEVRVSNGHTSQISFDLNAKSSFISKYDSFEEALDMEGVELVSFKGKVKSKESGAAVKGATVFLNGSPSSAKTNDQGDFELQVPKGDKFALSVIHENYRAGSMDDLESSFSGEGRSEVRLLPSMGEMSEVVVLAPKTKGSIEDLLKERKNMKTVSVSIGSEQFKKSGDSNAASALQRVSGLSLVEGKYVYVRGLGERYSSTALNGTMLPSPNPSRRVVPLDMFPTSLIESILIQKSYSVDKPAQFSAGLVEIRTLSIPKQKSFFKVSMSTGASSTSILKGKEKGLSYKGGAKDSFGYDDGSRDLPQAIKDIRDSKTPFEEEDPWFEIPGLTPEQFAEAGKSFSNNYNVDETKIGANYGMSFEGGRSFKFGSQKTGFILKGLYSSTNDQDLESRNNYVLGSGDDLVLERRDSIAETSNQINTGVIFSTGVDFFKRNKIDFTGIGTRATINETSLIIKDSLSNEEDSFRTTRLRYEERELLNFQAKGEHSLFENYKGPKLEWFLARSLSSNYRPDNREYSYYLTTGQFVDRGFGNERSFSDLKDIAEDRNLKLSGAFKAASWLRFDLFGGMRRFNKDRRSEVQRFTVSRKGSSGDYSLNDPLESILTPENFDNGEFQIKDSTNLTDNYTAGERTNALFASLGTSFLFSERSDLSLTVGVRQEDHVQDVRTFDIITGADSDDVARLSQKDEFYSYGAVYKMNEKASFRAGYSETVSRPDLQEFAPVIFFNDQENVLEQGNPNLKIADVQNTDVRFDYYFNKREFFSFGFFRKDITNPIETIAVVGLEDVRTYENIAGASNYGFELEFRQNMFQGVFLSGNYSAITSEVNIDKEDAKASTSLNRPLQGQSPYLLNIGLEYESRKRGVNTALVFNVAGRRISEVGSFGIPDVYEETFNQLDFTLSKKLSKKMSLSLKAQNILDPLAERTQGGESVRSLRYGRRYSLNLSTSI